MTKLPALALAGMAAAAIAGTAIAAHSATHVMNVQLPDGSVAHVQYVGDVAPKVTVEPRRFAGADGAWRPLALPSFAGFDQAIAQMNRQVQQMQQMARQPFAAPGMNVAAYGNSPAGATSTSICPTATAARPARGRPKWFRKVRASRPRSRPTSAAIVRRRRPRRSRARPSTAPEQRPPREVAQTGSISRCLGRALRLSPGRAFTNPPECSHPCRDASRISSTSASIPRWTT